EVETLARRKRRLVVIHAVARAQDGIALLSQCPGEAHARRPVVLVSRVAAPRKPIGPDSYQAPGRRVVEICAVERINRRRVVLITQACGDGQVRPDPETVIYVEAVALSAKMLMIVEVRPSRQSRKPKQQICKRVPGDRNLT